MQCVVLGCLLLARGIVPSRPRQSTESRVDKGRKGENNLSDGVLLKRDGALCSGRLTRQGREAQCGCATVDTNQWGAGNLCCCGLGPY